MATIISTMAVAIVFVASAGVATTVAGQLPDRQSVPPAGDPAVLTPSLTPGTRNPAFPPVVLEPTAEPPAAVRPGTVQRNPGPLPTRELVYLAPGEVPANVRVASTGPRSVTLQWSATPGASAYWVHQSQAGGPFYRGGSSTTETAFTVTGLLPGAAYSFKVSATYPREMQRSEGMSDAVSATTGAAPAPTGLTASVVGRGQVSLSWDGLPGADGFRLFRNGAVLSDIKPVTLTLGGPATLRTTFGDSVPPGKYLYQIQAVYRAGRIGQGAEAVSALAPTPPVGVTFKAFRFCQTGVGAAGCAEPGAPSVSIAASTPLRAAGRKSP